MYEDLAELAIKEALRLGASYAEARLEYSSENAFVLKNGTPELSEFGTGRGLGLRTIINGSLGFASTNNFDKKNILKTVDKAIKYSKSCSTMMNNPIQFSEEKTYTKRYEVKEKIKSESVDPSKKLELLYDLDKCFKKYNAPTRYFHFNDSITEKYFVNSEGTKIFSKIPRLDLFYLFTLQENHESIQRFFEFRGTGGFELLKTWNPEKKIKDEIKGSRDNLLKGVSAPKGKVDIIASPEVMGIASHESVGHPYEADRILGREGAQAGESFVTPKMIGEQIASNIVTVVDDPVIENSAGYYLYDDEGVKARRRFLIKNGKINEFLHNRESAKKMCMQSNGSARAVSYAVEPIVRMANTFVLPGDHSYEELLEGVKKGIFIENYMEWNIDDKRYNQKYVGNIAYLIENGKITKPVKKPIIEITTPAFWKSIDALGKKTEYMFGNCGKGEPMQGIPVSMGGPYARLRGIKLG